ncbi:hypothetical protein ACMZ9T_27265, partial [Klebsiella pneumoniae]
MEPDLGLVRARVRLIAADAGRGWGRSRSRQSQDESPAVRPGFPFSEGGARNARDFRIAGLHCPAHIVIIPLLLRGGAVWQLVG